MPTPLPSIDFHAHHSPFGAFASFLLGRFGRGGGFGLERGRPPQQEIFIGVTRPGEGARPLPFGPSLLESRDGWRPFAPEEITRRMGWASDAWSAGPLTVTLLTPFGPIPDIVQLGDGELRRHLCPAILAEIRLENSGAQTEAFAFFGVGDQTPLRPLTYISGGALRGIARAGAWGFAVLNADLAEGEAREALTWSLEETIASASSEVELPVHRLAGQGCLLLRAAPGETKSWTIALGFYRSGTVTSGIASTYLYTRLFPDLEAVLQYALENAAYYRDTCRNRDAELDAAPLMEERKFLLAHATHSYHASTMLLHDERGILPRAPFSPTAPLHRPLWVVNEGEYRMLNSFDLTADHAFWEMRFHPWTLKNALDLFVGRYSYVEGVQDALLPDRPYFPGGISFAHDMGVANQFAPPGCSAYEQSDLSGSFSYMTHEQLCNWCLSAALYALPAPRPLPLPGATLEGRNGDLLWLAGRRAMLHACLESLMRRDGPEDERDGVMSLDSVRCGTGQEITTYDTLDASLRQARAGIYLAVKTWAAYLALSRCFDALGEDEEAVEAEEQAARAAATITMHWNEEAEVLPAVLEPDHPAYAARVVPAIESLAFPYLLGDTDAVSPFGPYGELISCLRRHLKSILIPGICIAPESGGIRLSSTSSQAWMSKIFLCQFVAERVLGLPLDPALDRAHAGWQRDGACRDWAFTDQVHAPDGLDLGARCYPRGVTAVLWLPP